MGGTPNLSDSLEESDTTARRRRGDGRPAICSMRIILGDQVAAHPLPVVGEIALGRGADIVIPHVNISRRHMSLRVGPSLEVSDLGSTNLTTLFGTALEPHMWVPIRPGDILVLGGEALAMLHDGEARSLPTRQMGRETLDKEVAAKVAEHERSASPFTICNVTSRSSTRWLDVLAGVLLERDHLIVLSDTEAALILADRTEDQAEGVIKALEGHLARLGANARIRSRHCPRDGASPETLIEKPAIDNRAHRTTMRPAGPLVRNPAMLKLYELVDEVAPSLVNMLILGETGVGKDVLAHALHERSPRARAGFVSLNCSALPETLLESELFGYERGAFTGAVSSKSGLLETAEGGTIFLDEVGEMPLPTQAKLLRVLEDRTVRRVGGLKPRPIDVRVVAATNRDLAKEIAAGRFRADLYYRLNGLSVLVPPLRDRVDEIVLFATHFMTTAAAILNKPTPKLTVEARACLESYAWPGNIRELRNTIERAVLLARDRAITPDLFPPEVVGSSLPQPNNTLQPRPPLPTFHGDEALTGPLPKPPEVLGLRPNQWGDPTHPRRSASPTLVQVDDDPLLVLRPDPSPIISDTSGLLEEVEQLEKARIVEALAKCNGNQTRAAQLLGITRRVLIKRIERYNLPRPRGPQVG
jgi:two-component system, NtrC family, response regulator AtoC